MQFLQDKDFWNFVEHGTDTFRIFISKGALVERMGDGSIISYFLESDLETALRCLDKWTRRIHWTPQWVLARQRIKQPKHWKAPFFVQGKGFSPIQIVHENGLKYEIIFSTGHSGLFCDQRSNRLHLMQLKPKNLLNCFAYTCAFSVAAASTGSQTVNIDLAKRPLTRGRRNFNLNNIALNGRHRFLVEDVFSMLPKFARRGEKFHCIILEIRLLSPSQSVIPIFKCNMISRVYSKFRLHVSRQRDMSCFPPTVSR